MLQLDSVVQSASLARHAPGFPTVVCGGVRWHTVGDTVTISVLLVNAGAEPTPPRELRIEAAAFGAFVPFRPLGTVAVAAMDPGESRRVALQVPRQGLDSLNPPVVQERVRRAGSLEWAGNLNVYLDRDERNGYELHRAPGLRVPVGSGAELLFCIFSNRSLSTGLEVSANTSNPLWMLEVDDTCLDSRSGGAFASLQAWAPDRAGEDAHVEVAITRVRDGRTVLVEFEFTSVEGRGNHLGCVHLR